MFDDLLLSRVDVRDIDPGEEWIVYHGTAAQLEGGGLNNKHGYEGEGAQVYGWGTYVTGSPEVGEMYREQDVERKLGEVEGLPEGSSGYSDSFGRVYESVMKVQPFDDFVVLDWGLGDQIWAKDKELLDRLQADCWVLLGDVRMGEGGEYESEYGDLGEAEVVACLFLTGLYGKSSAQACFNRFFHRGWAEESAKLSTFLYNLGFRGFQYLTGWTRGKGSKSESMVAGALASHDITAWNFVIFNPGEDLEQVDHPVEDLEGGDGLFGGGEQRALFKQEDLVVDPRSLVGRGGGSVDVGGISTLSPGEVSEYVDDLVGSGEMTVPELGAVCVLSGSDPEYSMSWKDFSFEFCPVSTKLFSWREYMLMEAHSASDLVRLFSGEFEEFLGGKGMSFGDFKGLDLSEQGGVVNDFARDVGYSNSGGLVGSLISFERGLRADFKGMLQYVSGVFDYVLGSWSISVIPDSRGFGGIPDRMVEFYLENEDEWWGAGGRVSGDDGESRMLPFVIVLQCSGVPINLFFRAFLPYRELVLRGDREGGERHLDEFFEGNGWKNVSNVWGRRDPGAFWKNTLNPFGGASGVGGGGVKGVKGVKGVGSVGGRRGRGGGFGEASLFGGEDEGQASLFGEEGEVLESGVDLFGNQDDPLQADLDFGEKLDVEPTPEVRRRKLMERRAGNMARITPGYARFLDRLIEKAWDGLGFSGIDTMNASLARSQSELMKRKTGSYGYAFVMEIVDKRDFWKSGGAFNKASLRWRKNGPSFYSGKRFDPRRGVEVLTFYAPSEAYYVKTHPDTSTGSLDFDGDSSVIQASFEICV